MDFFKSVFANNPDPSNHPPEEEDDHGNGGEKADNSNPTAPSFGDTDGGGSVGEWSFGGLIKTFASKSESVIQIYRQDLQEFGSGLKKETSVIRETVRVLPESLESVGQAIDDFGGSVWRGTAEIISHGKEALLSVDDDQGVENATTSSKRYNRFQAQVLAIQSDSSTFLEEPEDADKFQEWRAGFDLAEKMEEIENLCYENGDLDGLFEKLAPSTVDYDTFWSRYYYRVHKLKQAEDARSNLVKRAISGEEEELSWEVDDDDGEEEMKEENREEIKEKGEEEEKGDEEEEIEAESRKEIKADEKEEEKEEVAVKTLEFLAEKHAEVSQVENLEASKSTLDEELSPMAGKADDDETNGGDRDSLPRESFKESCSSVVSRQPSMQEEDDLRWDEIEDLGEDDDKIVSGSGGTTNRMDLRKRLSATEEDEDLNWDIEEDDEPSKA